MAVAIIRQLTLAQVQAAIDAGSTSWNNNYAGTQVYVTDKDWHLACYLDRIAKPLSGVLKINNGDTLPNWLTPETLLIDTGVVTSDISSTPISIAIPSGYFFNQITQIELSTDDVITDISLLDNAAVEIAKMYLRDYETGEYCPTNITKVDSGFPVTSPLTLTCIGWGGTSPSIQAIIEFKKSYL